MKTQEVYFSCHILSVACPAWGGGAGQGSSRAGVSCPSLCQEDRVRARGMLSWSWSWLGVWGGDRVRATLSWSWLGGDGAGGTLSWSWPVQLKISKTFWGDGVGTGGEDASSLFYGHDFNVHKHLMKYHKQENDKAKGYFTPTDTDSNIASNNIISLENK